MMAGAAETSPLGCNGVFPFSEPVLVTFIDLDHLIEQAPLTRAERRVVGDLMLGYAEPDIADHYGTTLSHVRTLLASAVDKIVEQENKNWKSCGNYMRGGFFIESL